MVKGTAELSRPPLPEPTLARADSNGEELHKSRDQLTSEMQVRLITLYANARIRLIR